MRFKEVSGSSILKGLAQVQVKNGQAAVLFKGDKDPLRFGIEGTPEGLKDGRYYLKSLGDEKILSYGPILGTFKAKVKRFAENKEGIPTPITQDGKFGPYEMFYVELEILDFVPGATATVGYPYKFFEEDVEMKGRTVVAGRGKNWERLQDFFEATGAIDYDIPYSDNILPALQKIILKLKKEFVVMIKDGFVDSVAEDPNSSWEKEVPDVEEVAETESDPFTEESWTPDFDD